MSYTPTNWATGDVITAEKLNNMESGIAGAGKGFFVVNATGVADAQNTMTQPTLDKTFAEISAAYQSGLTPVILATPIINGRSVGEAIVPFSARMDIQGETFAFLNTTMSDRGSAIYLSSVTITLTAELCASAYVEKVLE